jgi:hypothetical protein
MLVNLEAIRAPNGRRTTEPRLLAGVETDPPKADPKGE